MVIEKKECYLYICHLIHYGLQIIENWLKYYARMCVFPTYVKGM